MIKYTTPTISLIVEGVDITAHDIYVTLEQGLTELVKTGADLVATTITEDQMTSTRITLTLTQTESAMSIITRAHPFRSTGSRPRA